MSMNTLTANSASGSSTRHCAPRNMAPEMPTRVAMLDMASLRWCHALAMTAVLPMLLPTRLVYWNSSSLATIEIAAIARAKYPGLSSICPWQAAITLLAPLHARPTPTTARASAMRNVAKVSNLPWPYRYSLLMPRAETPTNTITTMSVRKSLSECTPSAIIAPELPSTPAATFRADSSPLTANPVSVQRLALAARCSKSMSTLVCIIIFANLANKFGGAVQCWHNSRV